MAISPINWTICRVKPGIFGHQVNSDIRLQTVEIQMRRLMMSHHILSFQCLQNNNSVKSGTLQPSRCLSYKRLVNSLRNMHICVVILVLEHSYLAYAK